MDGYKTDLSTTWVMTLQLGKPFIRLTSWESVAAIFLLAGPCYSLFSSGWAKRERMGPTGQLRAALVFKIQGGCDCWSVSSPQLLPEMEFACADAAGYSCVLRGCRPEHARRRGYQLAYRRPTLFAMTGSWQPQAGSICSKMRSGTCGISAV